MNFGNLSQIIPIPTRVFSCLCHTATDKNATSTAQIPTNISLPITLMSVKAAMARSSPMDCAAANPAESANSEVPIQAPATPPSKPKA